MAKGVPTPSREAPAAANDAIARSNFARPAEDAKAPNPEAKGGAQGGASSKSPSKEAPIETGARPRTFIRQYELVDRVRDYDPHADEDLLNRAYVFAMRAHGDQERLSGDPYFSHPLEVAGILTDLKADPATIVTALL
ncbi:MAG: HD domain-containing protein, partial [Pseudomonadota bacterium]